MAGFQIFFTVVLIVITRLLIFLGPSLMSLALTEVAADLKAVGTGSLGLGELILILEAVVLDSTAAEVGLAIRETNLVDPPKKGLLTTGASK
ncbi:hypothetical protein G6F43_013397 [Rhizopus delemar]|nr:hypothetical protein G6F43_013397 [Rhizopus delemar]